MSDVLWKVDLRLLQNIGVEPLSLAGEAAVIASSLAVVGSFFWFPALVVYLYRKHCTTRRRKIMLLLLVVLLVYVPVKPWDRARRNWLFDQWIKYFSVRTAFEQPLPTDRPFIFAMSPHGIYPFGQAMGLVGKLSAMFHDMRPVTADMALRAPVFRHLLGWVGAIGASRKSMKKALAEGNSLCLIPGGMAEMFRSTPTKDIVLLNARKGFIRLAIETGTDVVPSYCFGNSELLTLAPLSRRLESFSRHLRLSLLFFWGRWGLPIPFKRPLLYAVGAPIRIAKLPADQITQAHVDKVHAEFVAAVLALYDKYKHVHGCGAKTLLVQ